MLASFALHSAIHREPVETELTHGVDELVEIDGFADVGICAQLVALDDVSLFVRRRQHHDGKRLGRRLLANLCENLEAGDLGQLQVEQDEVREASSGACAEEVIDRFRAVAGNSNDVRHFALPHRAERQLLVVRVVFHQEDRFRFRRHESFRS